MEMHKKLTTLGLIHENKNILFGKLSEQLTKVQKWKEIAEQLTASGILIKDWKYLRDTTWQNWRKRTLEKRDKRLQPGSGGGKKIKYDDSDEMILKIIGKDSTAIDGLQVPESSKSNKTKVVPVFTTEATPLQINHSNTQKISPIHRKSDPPRRLTRESKCEVDLSDDMIDLNKKKMEIEVEIAKEKLQIAQREKYKLALELLKLEKELNLQPSEFTLPLYIKNDIDDTQNE